MKKGSLNLSIQAIVILVMAMAVLGLGLGFIRTLIGQGQNQFTTAIDNAQLENPASAAQPVTVDRNVEVSSSGSAKMKIGFFNKEWTTTSWIPTLDATCDSKFDLKTGTQTVPIGQGKGYEALLVPAGATVGEEYVCTIEFKEGTDVRASKQFFVTVTS